jgi:RHS repeat-associated protein
MQTYNYDGVNRLVCANEVGGAASLTCGTGTPNWWLTFGYDGWGNHWLSNDPNGAGIPISPFTPKSQTDYDGSNHLLTDSALFDTAGNQKQIGGFQFGYDSENRLTSSVFTPTSASQTTAQYDYDGFGRRVRKTVNGQATTYVYDATGQLAVEYGSTTDAGTNYLTADHLGSTRLITDARGSVARCYDYLPFGEEIGNGTAGRTDPCFGSATYPAPQDIESAKFTGKQRDAETGLDYFGARYFSAAQGRFMSPDSTAYSKMSNPQSWNLYAYSFNNPLRFIDPTGNEVQAANCGTEQGCQKTLAAVRGSLANQQAANRVGLQKIERGFWGRIGAWITGAPQFRFTISGDMASFKALGQNASRFGQLVENKTVVTAAVSDMYPSYGGSQRTTPGGFSGLPSKGLDPAATVANNPTPFDTDASPGANVNETMAHELLGHVWGEIVANHPAESFWNLRDSVEAENAVRATDPSRGLKFQHHGDPSPTVVYSQQEIEEMQKKR